MRMAFWELPHARTTPRISQIALYFGIWGVTDKVSVGIIMGMNVMVNQIVNKQKLFSTLPSSR
jgi:hypothetical protein